MAHQHHSFTIQYFQDEDGVFTALVPSIKGCIASGKTLEEAYKNAIDAIESCIEAREIIRESMQISQNPYEKIHSYTPDSSLAYA